MNKNLRLISLVIVFLVVFSYWLITNQSNQACAQSQNPWAPLGCIEIEPRQAQISRLCVERYGCINTEHGFGSDGVYCESPRFLVGYRDRGWSSDVAKCCRARVISCSKHGWAWPPVTP